ncbi:Glu-tRNA(Gln) amidotransferase GatDE subunit E, partial [Candidatus Woesearchaeota archaeon]
MDWEKIGLTCGIEIHQQIEGHKLFCNCPTIIREDAADFSVMRKLRATIGETGEVDVAAAAEMAKSKTYEYQGYTDTTCLVELDEEPPHLMNQDALFAGVQTAMLLNAKLVDEVQVMRKTVVDGSNTSGFQRTALIARNGSFQTSQGTITIPTISIEEDSCKIVERGTSKDVYNLSRLGIPLIEIGTGPDIKTPQQAKEAAAHIGMVLRSTGKAKRGLGTIRQDVNVSIAGGNRIEIKGAQDLKLIPTLVEYEAKRQMELLRVRKELGSFDVDETLYDVTHVLEKSESKVVQSCLEKKGKVKALKLPFLKGFFGREVQPGRRIGTELSDYAKVAGGVKGLFHSDELPKYGITQEEFDALKEHLGDGFCLIADEEWRVDTALKAVLERVKMLGRGVPKEVRKANDDGTTSYMRPMPGAARLYPETDALPVRIDPSHIILPELITQRIERFKEEYGLSEDLARDLCRHNYADLFESFAKRFTSVKTAFMAESMISLPKTIGKKHNLEITVSDEQWELIFDALNKG